MPWTVAFHADFDLEFKELDEAVQDMLLARLVALREVGPRLKRPYADTLNGSRFKNMKELRFNAADGVWRFAFAFDPKKQAIVLCGGDKSGTATKRFYDGLVRKADDRFRRHLEGV
jgi:hypothetical protein